MANKSQNQNNNLSKTWVRVMCGFLGLLMIAAVVFMLVQILMG